MTKERKQLVLLGVLLAAIAVVLIAFVFKPGGEAPPAETPYQAASIDPAIPDGVVKHPEYRSLASPVELPLVPGKTGRDNPFEPY